MAYPKVSGSNPSDRTDTCIPIEGTAPYKYGRMYKSVKGAIATIVPRVTHFSCWRKIGVLART